MALLVVLLSADEGEVPLGSDSIEALARLGVTTVSLARDEHTAAVILEGWAFDPTRANAALTALGPGADKARTLQPVVQMAVTTAVNEGGTTR